MSNRYRRKKSNSRPKAGKNKVFICLVLFVVILFTADMVYIVTHLEESVAKTDAEEVITLEDLELLEDVEEPEGDPEEELEENLEEENIEDILDIGEADTSTLYYFYNQLSKEDQIVYDECLESLENMEETITYSGSDYEYISSILDQIFYDHSELFWWGGGWSYTTRTSTSDVEIIFTFTYPYDSVEMLRRKEEIESNSADILQEASTLTSDYEKVKLIFEYLIDTVTYVEGSSDNQNIYSSLVNKETICAGYARGTQYLLNCLGIQCLYVSGDVTDEEGIEPHGWNIVRCDDLYYQVDTTFGDNESLENSYDIEGLGTNYSYLCCTDDIMYITREETMDFEIPECTSDDLNYCGMNDCFYDEYTSDIIEGFKEYLQEEEDFWTVQLADESLYNQVLEDIYGNTYIDAVGEYFEEVGYSGKYSLGYSNDDNTYTIKCWAGQS